MPKLTYGAVASVISSADEITTLLFADNDPQMVQVLGKLANTESSRHRLRSAVNALRNAMRVFSQTEIGE
jgi:hypothetical protein